MRPGPGAPLGGAAILPKSWVCDVRNIRAAQAGEKLMLGPSYREPVTSWNFGAAFKDLVARSGGRADHATWSALWARMGGVKTV